MFTKPKSLDSILSTFTSLIEQIDTLTSANEETIMENGEKVKQLVEANGQLARENNRAAAVREKISEIVN